MTAQQSSASSASHKAMAAEQGTISVAIVTVGDTRTPETDVNAQFLREQIAAVQHQVAAYHLIKDEPDQVQQALEDFAAGDAQIIIFNGGTGISKRDRTYDVLSNALEKTLPGFGEIFRMLSYEEIGSAAMMSRATAGTYQDSVVISTPGSSNAVRLAMEKECSRHR